MKQWWCELRRPKQILNGDIIVAVVIVITTCWLVQVSHCPWKSPLKTVLVKAVYAHFNDSRK